MLLASQLPSLNLSVSASSFSSGFETGDTSEWDSVYATFEVQTNRTHSGVYAGVAWDSGEVRKTISPQVNNVTVSGSFNFQDFSYSSDGLGFSIIDVATIEVLTPRNGSDYYFNMYYSYAWLDGGQILSVPISLDTWYDVQVQYYTNTTGSGFAAIWIDSVLKGNYTFSDASPHYASQIRVGLATWEGGGKTENEIIWVDDVEYTTETLYSFPFFDDFESGTFEKWYAMAGGMGFQISSEIVRRGIYSAKGLISGDGMVANTTFRNATLYLTKYFYMNGTIPLFTPYDAYIAVFYANTTGKGLAIKWNSWTNGTGYLSLYDEWSGAEANGYKAITLNEWHKIYCIARSGNASSVSELYLDDLFIANITIPLAGYEFDYMVMEQNKNTFWSWYIDDITLSDTLAETANTVIVSASPADVGSIGFVRDSGTARTTPYEENVSVATHVWERSEATKTKNGTCIYGFDYWMVTNSSGSFNVTGATITLPIDEPTNITLVYSVHLIRVTSSPEVSADFTESGYALTTPQNIYRGNFSHTFTPESTIAVNATFQYQFAYWQLNSTSYIGTTLTFTSDYPTNVTLFYTLAYIPPVIPFIYNTGALNATYYMRSDTHTIHDELGYKLLTENTQTPAFDEKLSATTQNVSYGIRVWTVSYLGYEYELTSGNPVGIVTKTDAGGEMLVANWNCPAWSSMIDSLKVRVYQRFDSEAWSLRRIFITKTGLYYRLPAGSWTIHYYVIRTVGSTNSTFGHGSYTTFNSRIDLQYYKANPWELALARLMQRNYLGFLFTPWTYWFGDLFWTIILFGCIIMFYLRTGSLKPVLALLWILGGSGSILWALIPATALHIAVIMLALAMTFSILRLISK